MKRMYRLNIKSSPKRKIIIIIKPNVALLMNIFFSWFKVPSSPVYFGLVLRYQKQTEKKGEACLIILRIFRQFTLDNK